MASYGLRLRPARAHDAGLLRSWRQDPAVQETFGEGDEPLGDGGDALLLIIEEGSRPVGQVRLRRVEGGVADVRIALASSSRGRGVGRRALEIAAEDARSQLGAEAVRAIVRLDDEPSMRAFTAAGYQEASRDGETVELRREL